MISARYAGTATSIVSSDPDPNPATDSGTAPKRIFRRCLAISSLLRSKPSRATASVREMVRIAGLRSGVVYPPLPSGVHTCTDSILPPRSASAVTTMFNAANTALPVPVTSMNRFFVSSSTRVNVPLMIGGKDSTFSFESMISGYLSNLSARCANLTPFGCFLSISVIDIGVSKSSGTNS
uniref:Uncharacterized protein n=1 Tax=Candidatus Methanogaster sp. ANME-2c ERB4 TaxID=2759911 RepID=A0A7G9YK26_9EURY|nr:hypothetical protein KGAOHLBL_00004 [Methanosarcinales archaeon ANME-2c ERB4]